MKTLVTAIQKGGQGKTFATCHLAFDFQERGLRVAVIDLDTQGNASWTLAGHDSGYPASRMFTAGGDELRAWFADREDDGLALIAADANLANLDKMELSQAAAALRASSVPLDERRTLAAPLWPGVLGRVWSAAYWPTLRFHGFDPDGQVPLPFELVPDNEVTASHPSPPGK